MIDADSVEGDSQPLRPYCVLQKATRLNGQLETEGVEPLQGNMACIVHADCM